MNKTPEQLTDEIEQLLKANNAAGLVIVYMCSTMEESPEQVDGRSHYRLCIGATNLPFSNAFPSHKGIHFKAVPEWSAEEKAYRAAATVNMMEAITGLGGHVVMQLMDITEKLSKEYNK